MNRKLIVAVAFTAVVAGGYLAHNIQKQSDEQLSDLMIENIEALATGELPSPCNNVSGYKKWLTSSPTGFPKEKFRDCCYKEKSGYNPTGCLE